MLGAVLCFRQGRGLFQAGERGATAAAGGMMSPNKAGAGGSGSGGAGQEVSGVVGECWGVVSGQVKVQLCFPVRPVRAAVAVAVLHRR